METKLVKIVGFGLALSFSGLLAFGQRTSPDWILVNGKIFTSDATHPYVQALAIRGERIVATGSSENIAALSGPGTKRLDLGGRTVVPGFNDAHYHLFVEPPTFHLRFADQEPTWKEVADSITAAESTVPKGVMIRGEIGPAALEDARASRATLDALAPEHAVYLSTWSEHAAVLNSRTIRLLGLREDEPNPKGGTYVRSTDGKLTGVVLEFAKFRVEMKLNDLASENDALKQTRDFLRTAARFGITSVQIMSHPVDPKRCERLVAAAPTRIRVRIIHFHLTDELGGSSGLGSRVPRSSAPLVTMSGTKWVLDGVPPDRSAAMREPYTDRPGISGQMFFTEKEMEAMLRESLKSGDQLIAHATGDRTSATFLKAMEATGGPAVWVNRRVRIEHGDGLAPDLVPAVRKMGIIVVENPTHFTLGDMLIRRYGAKRAKLEIPFRSLLTAGIPVAIGSDGPLNPYLNIMFASTYPGKPDEALTREEAVTAYTLTSAYSEFAEKDKGSLVSGKFADLAVLSQDIFGVPARELPGTVSVLTMVGGTIVYDAKVISAH